MEAAEAKIQKVLEGNKQFLVPDDHRHYSWREEQWQTLWQDLLELLQDADAKPHFFGSIVTSHTWSAPDGVEKRLLIDGQQRLTTLLVLLALLRDLARKSGLRKIGDQIHSQLLVNPFEEGLERYRLLPAPSGDSSESDRDAFLSIIDGAEGAGAGAGAAYRFFENELKREDAPGVERLFRALVNKVTLVSIVLDERDEPLRIFQGLNGKGRPLPQASQRKEVQAPEPWRVKVVERIRWLDREAREQRLIEANFNLFRIASEDVFIDLFTDSGTSAMSDKQWAALMIGDEAYARSRNFKRFEQVVRSVFGFKHVLPTHQGRGAENVLFASLVRPGHIVPSNGHFDTSVAHIQLNGGQAIDLPIEAAFEPMREHPFKGNIDIARAREFFAKTPREKIPLAMMTLTNNAGGGQPASLENIRAMAELCREYETPFYIDACRFAENAWFIKQREPGQRDRPVADIAHEIFSLADGCTMSAKKDGLANIGGFVATNDEKVAEALAGRTILFEGFTTYGGLAGRDLEAIAQGLREVVDDEYLRFRVGQVAAFGERLAALGVPTIRPTGGHAVYVDAKALLPHLPQSQYPAQALAIAMYREGGVRVSEVGGVTMSRTDPATGAKILPRLELARFCVPRRVYTDAHLAFVASIVGRVREAGEKIRGVQITKAPAILPHFSAYFAEI